ncbi:MAG: zinc-binding dehydrogenase, partial [Acutalibacteraceae bacterium]
CNSCQKGVYELCAHYNYLGSRCDGAFAEYVAVPVWNLVPMPDSLSYEQAAMSEPVSVALHSLRRAKIEIGDTVAIYGPGTIGILIGMWVKAWGASRVLMVGTDHTNVEFLRSLGFDEFVNGRREDAAAWIKERTGGIGADITIESSGSVQALCGCLSGVAPGGKVICVGNPKGDFNLPKDIYWQILRKQLVMYGTWNSSFDNSDKNDWKIAIEAMASGKIQNDKLITHKFSLEDMDKGLDIMRNATEFYSKIIVTP